MERYLEAYTYQRLEDNSYLLKAVTDSCVLTDELKRLIDKVRATKCIDICDFYTADRSMSVVLNPELYFALKGQMINPTNNISKDDRSNLARLLNLKKCIIRIT